MNVPISKKNKITVVGSGDIFPVMQEILKHENHVDREKEHFWIIGLNNGNTILFIELVALGGTKAVNVEPMNVFRVSVLKGATKVILVHNHPSNTLKANDTDKDLTDRLIQVGKILDIQVIDHLIITTKSYISFNDKGLMEELAKSIKWTPTYVVVEQIRKEEKKIRQEAIQTERKKAKADKEKALEKAEVEKEKAIKNKEIDFARTMKKEGELIEKIIKYTGLSKKEIEKIK